MDQIQKPALTGQNNGNSTMVSVLDWADSIVLSVLCIILIFTFGFRMVGVKGSSMEDTLFTKDKVIILSAFYHPQAGDIVVISRADLINEDGEAAEPIIKRIIATENQTINIDFTTGTVSVDGVVLDEPYIKDATINNGLIPMEFPYTVPEGHVFVMGDHRSVSKDSRTREVGAIDTRYILGKAVLRVYPFSSIGLID